MSNTFIPIIPAELSWYHNLPVCSKSQEDCYFNSDALDQSRHDYIDANQLTERWQSLPNEDSTHFIIAETCFGWGLNFLLSWSLWNQHAPSKAHLHFISCEKNPLVLDDLIKALKSCPQLDSLAQELIKSYPILTPGIHKLSFAEGSVTLTLMLGDMTKCYHQLLICGQSPLEAELRTYFIDAWFLNKSPFQINTDDACDTIISIIAMMSKRGTTLSSCSYSEKIQMSLNQYGFVVNQHEQLTTARFKEVKSYRMRIRNTPWHVGTNTKQSQKKAIVLGAGLAGCFVAHSLAKKDWDVIVVDENSSVGAGASGNEHAVLFPKLSAFKSPLMEFMLHAFLYAHRIYENILRQHAIGELNGALVLAHNKKEWLAQQSMHWWLELYPQLGRLVDKELGSNLTGLNLDRDGLYIPLSGWMNSPALCERLIQTPGVRLQLNQKISEIRQDADTDWIAGQYKAPILILANGYKAQSFQQTEYLSLKSIRGQMTSIPATRESSFLKIPLCAEAHVLPAIHGVHSLGATYELGVTTAYCSATDDASNQLKLLQTAPEVSWSDEVVDHWAGIRTSTPDYLPLVGQIAQEIEFLNLFKGLDSNSKRWIPTCGSYYSGLYAFSGFGSRGLTTIPLSAEWLASMLNNEPSCLPLHLIQAISPSRFLRRNISRGIY